MHGLRFVALALVLGGSALADPPFRRDYWDPENQPTLSELDPTAVIDNPTRRREALLRWFGEWSPEYRAHLAKVVGEERERYGRMVAGRGLEMAAAPSSGTWISLGPTKADVIKNGSSTLNKTDSGRPRTILVDPNNSQVIYLCTAAGGVWKTTNGGASWAPITETLGSLSCGYLAMHPTQSQTLFLGLGDPFDGTGLGLVKSTDGGTTWSAPILLGNSRSIRSILVLPSNANVVLVSTDQGLYRSTDGGSSYALVASVPATYGCWDLAVSATGLVLSLESDPANANGATAGKLFRSTDQGATWTAGTGPAATACRMSVAAAPSNRSILYAMASDSAGQFLAIYKSSDSGATWAKLRTTGIADILNGQGWYNHLLLVDQANPNTLYAGGALYLAKSTNGGTKWTKKTEWLGRNGLPYVHADFHAGAQDASGVLYAGTDGGIFKSTDGGTSWTDALNVGITSHLIYALGSSDAAPDAVIGGFQDNGTRVRSGATSTFNQYIGGDGFGCLMHPATAGTMLGSLYYTDIYKSTNGGTTFTSASSGITERGNSSTAPFWTRLAPGLADATGNTVYTFSNTKVYKSTNYAGSWTALGTSGLPTTSFYIRNVGTAKSNANVVGIVANSGRVFLTSNGGASWSTPAALPNNGSYTSSVAFDPADYNVVYVSSVAPDGTKSHLWKSSNFGASWTAVDTNGLPAGMPVNVVTVDPGDRNVVYAGTHTGVYRSGDGGSTWARWGTALPQVSVMDIWINGSGSKVRVATYGRGFWQLGN